MVELVHCTVVLTGPVRSSGASGRMTPKSISVPGPDRIGYQSVGYWYPDGPDTGCPVSQYTPDSHRTGYAKTSQIEIVPPAGPDTDSARGESAPAGPDGPDVRMSGTMVLVLL